MEWYSKLITKGEGNGRREVRVFNDWWCSTVSYNDALDSQRNKYCFCWYLTWILTITLKGKGYLKSSLFKHLFHYPGTIQNMQMHVLFECQIHHFSCLFSFLCTRVRTHAIKFAESLIIAFSEKTSDSDVNKKNESDFSLDQVVQLYCVIQLKVLQA